MSALTSPRHISAPANDLELFNRVMREGALLTDREVMEKMDLTLPHLASLYQNNAILGVAYKGDIVFPAMQFEQAAGEPMRVSAYFRNLLGALPAPLTGLDRLYFLFSPIIFDDRRVFTPADYRHTFTASQSGAHEMMVILRHASVFTRNTLLKRRA